MKLDSIAKAALAIAALLAAGTYAWNTFFDHAPAVQAAGVDTEEGFGVEGFGFNRQGGYICVSRMIENPFEDGQGKRLSITFYELVKTGGDGQARLYLIGSRVIDYDMGPDLVKFEHVKGETPNDLKEAMEKFKKSRKKGSTNKKSPDED